MVESTQGSGARWWEVTDLDEALAAYLRQANTTYNRAKVEMYERLMEKDLAGKTVLDYGGGGGFMSIRCARRGAQVTLVEPDATALRLAHHYIRREGMTERITCIQSDHVPEALRGGGRRFDVVLLKDLVEHVPDDALLLRDVASLQAVGGQLLLSTPNRLSLNFLLEGTYQRWWCGNRAWLGWDPTHVRMHTPWSLRRVLRDSGYAPTRWWGLYVIPYDVLSWFFLLRKKIVLTGLHRFDLTAGRWFPFNRCGWNIVLEAKRKSA